MNADGKAQVQGVSSLVCVFFSDAPVTDYAAAQSCDTERFASYFAGMLDEGIYIAPSQFEALFVSAAHTDADIDATVEAAARVFAKL